MPLALSHEALYASFDRFPSRKGSAVHIDRFARALFAHAGGGLLYVLGGDGLPPYQREAEVEIVRFSRPTDNYLERALAFSARWSCREPDFPMRPGGSTEWRILWDQRHSRKIQSTPVRCQSLYESDVALYRHTGAV